MRLYFISICRNQARNKADCMDKLKLMLYEAYLEPKEREMWVGLSDKGKAIRKDEKRKRGDIKNSRRQQRDYDD